MNSPCYKQQISQVLITTRNIGTNEETKCTKSTQYIEKNANSVKILLTLILYHQRLEFEKLVLIIQYFI